MIILFSVFMPGIGDPSIPGSGPICVAVILSQMGVPMGIITLIIGLDPLVSMFKSACSCIEDSYVMLALAKSEKKLRKEVLYQEKQKNKLRLEQEYMSETCLIVQSGRRAAAMRCGSFLRL